MTPVYSVPGVPDAKPREVPARAEVHACATSARLTIEAANVDLVANVFAPPAQQQERLTQLLKFALAKLEERGSGG